MELVKQSPSPYMYNYLEKMNMINLVEMVCFDTTATNTGKRNGAGMLLEQKLKRSLLCLPCRHHIAEIILRAVFEIYFGKSCGPEVAIFERFSREWNTFNLKDLSIGIMDEEVRRALNTEECEANKEFWIKNIAKDHIRHDYKELLQLMFIFLGGSTPNFSFRALGATSHARFMSKAIYALKMFALQKQFKMSSSHLNGFRNVCIFLVRLYIPYWFRTTNAVEAPNLDLQLIKNIAGYYDPKISLALLDKMKKHLWYLSEEAVGLAFFDSNVDLNVKRKMVEALALEKEFESNDDNGVYLRKNVNASIEEMKAFISKDLSCFVTQRTRNIFSRLEIDVKFFNLDPSNWCENAEYLKGVQILKNVTAVNDSAERKVKLITDFNRPLTHSEEDKQYLLHIVENYRQKFPSYTKTSLL
ncbi:uncharacterized protein LOC125777466 [Bactrocera dorsalis]|uniref:Uncharacterized protein LOC125777466 n=1 Tax=Bactrocera dorsalis TaxID=27457 RepID=A0ABM3JGT5_BACDO|nr:uncharacterized protein LOC125777466 [Bactrocera dorsalis]